jgi:hypothetical protein
MSRGYVGDAAELEIQWNAFVELLPLWLAPNMVTLLGFMCILFNVGLLVVMMPDLEGPVRFLARYSQILQAQADDVLSVLCVLGATVGILQLRLRTLHVPDI